MSFLYTLLILCITVKIHVWAMAGSSRPISCRTNLPETKVLETAIYNYKVHKTAFEQSASKSMCATRDTLVEVVAASANTLYYPSKVMVKRCDGGVMGKKTCLATNSIPKQYTVLRMDLLDAKVMFAVVVEIMEHTKCRPGCLTMEEDCSEMQTFMKDKCMCVCAQIQKCTKVMLWDPNECRCVCHQKPNMCTTGKKWNKESCSCESAENLLDEDGYGDGDFHMDRNNT